MCDSWPSPWHTVGAPQSARWQDCPQQPGAHAVSASPEGGPGPLTLWEHSSGQLRPQMGGLSRQGPSGQHCPPHSQCSLAPCLCPATSRKPSLVGPSPGSLTAAPTSTETWGAWPWEPRGDRLGGPLPATEGTIRQPGTFQRAAGRRLAYLIRQLAGPWERLLALSPVSPGPGSKGEGVTRLWPGLSGSSHPDESLRDLRHFSLFPW